MNLKAIVLSATLEIAYWEREVSNLVLLNL